MLHCLLSCYTALLSVVESTFNTVWALWGRGVCVCKIRDNRCMHVYPLFCGVRCVRLLRGVGIQA